VKVFGKNGKDSEPGEIAQAILDVIDEHNKNKANIDEDNDFWKFRGSLINMSFTIGYQPTVLLNQMIKANDRGISIFAGAGNKNKDAGNGYPCAQVQAKCVAAVDNTYNKAKFSNYGSVVDFIAPGKDISMCIDNLEVCFHIEC
jgi:subtilisin family serine protease